MRTIALKPVLSEKSVAAADQGKYVFSAPKSASKTEVAQAVGKLFDVKVVRVHRINIGGKKKTFKRVAGTQQDKHKFVVTLKKGDKIELLEGAK